MKSSEPNRAKVSFPPLSIPDVVPNFEVPRPTPTVTISPPTPVRPNQLTILNPLRPFENPDERFNGHCHQSESMQPDLDNSKVIRNLGQGLDSIILHLVWCDFFVHILIIDFFWLILCLE